MGSGLSCCWCRGSGGSRDSRPSHRNKGKENDSKSMQQEYLTLEDWLSADDCEIQALRRFSIKIHESLLDDVDRGGGGGELSSDTHWDSISEAGKGDLEVIVSEAGKGDLEVITSFDRIRSRKGQKRVSFRLPEQGDIIVFDSPGSGCTESETNKK